MPQPMEPEQAAETLYVATRNMQQGADFHDQMRTAFASLIGFIKEKTAPPEPKGGPTNVDGKKKEDGEKGEKAA